ncbi:acyltransferase family protein [Candidatus Saccharibacteria bacterium]|nr:acyltransferase family protein [Candidatus Saccharibacteria bacterium]
MRFIIKKRVAYIDILRAIAIILVIIGHISYPGFTTAIYKKLIYSFHIPLFFFVSGLSMSFTKYKGLNLKENLKKRFLRIYLPFLIWAILFTLPVISLESIPNVLYGTHETLFISSHSSLWYLPVLFISTVLMDLLLYWIKNKTKLKTYYFLIPILAIAILCSVEPLGPILNGLPLGINIVPMALFFILLGHSYQNEYNRKKPSILISLPIIIALCAVIYYFGINNNINYASMAENRYGNIFYFLMTAISGIVVCLLLTFIIERYIKPLQKPMQIIGENTFIIFVLHKYPLILINQLFILDPAIYFSNWLIVPVYLAAALLICLPLSLYIRKNLPLLAGAQEIKKT